MAPEYLVSLDAEDGGNGRNPFGTRFIPACRLESKKSATPAALRNNVLLNAPAPLDRWRAAVPDVSGARRL